MKRSKIEATLKKGNKLFVCKNFNLPNTYNTSKYLQMHNSKDSKYRKETKHFCKFCKIFVQNNLAQISRHEKEPGHLRRMSRLVDSINAAGTKGASKSTAKTTKPTAKSINPLLYGLGQDSLADIPSEQDFKRDFQTTEAFELANPKVVLAARLPSAWEEVEEDEGEPPSNTHEPIHDTSLNTELVKVKDESDESDEEKFKVTTKTLLSASTVSAAGDEKPLAFKKRKNLKSKIVKK